MRFETMDGNTACALIAYKLSDISAIYPITPSSTMGELVEKWSSEGQLNIFDQTLLVKEMQSEAGVSGALHGAIQTGSLATTFTSSQGLLLMIPNMYKIAGECLPCVFHVSARAVATHALSIFGDHSDVMSTRSTGFNMVCSSSVQECYDMALFSHILTLKTSLPILHFFDGFRTSHEIQKIQVLDDNQIKSIYPYDSLTEFKKRALTPSNPKAMGTAQNPDVFFQNRERANLLYENVLNLAKQTFCDIKNITGRNYAPFEYYGDASAEYVVVSMGSSTNTLKEAVDYMNKNGKKLGLVNVRLYRPFFAKEFASLLPASCKKIAVLDRTKESGAVGEPLYSDVCSAIHENNMPIQVIGGRYGIGGKEFNFDHAISVLNNLQNEFKNHFTIGIDDDITNTSLKVESLQNEDDDCLNIKFYGLGSDGTVSAVKNTIKIIGEKTDKFVQGFFEYDSKKSGSLTISRIRISDKQINKPYNAKQYDYICINNFNFAQRYNLLFDLKQNGTVLLNTSLDAKSLQDNLPEHFVTLLKQKNAKLYTIDANKIASKHNLGNKVNTIMQTAFFKLLDLPFDYVSEIKENVAKTYSGKGQDILAQNNIAIDETILNIIEQPFNSWTGKKQETQNKNNCEFYNNVISKVEDLQGNSLPVSVFNIDGNMPTNTSKYLKRSMANNLPQWIKENCIQCGFCTLACPHSCLRSKLVKNSDADQTFVDAIGMKDYKFKIDLSPLDCTGCGVCAKTCPAIKKALEMKNSEQILENCKKEHEFSQNLNNEQSIFNNYTAKGLQFKNPYFEYSYACAGCGETPYIKILTQLFGDQMIVANATGCSSIYGGSYPVCPYTKNKDGYGVAWSNSLFEDNAEFGYGMAMTIAQNKKKINNFIKQILPTKNDKLNKLLIEWQFNQQCNVDTKNQIVELLKNENSPQSKSLVDLCDDLTKKSVWIIGGDGWAYDIGFGGLDHVLNSKENVNILVLDSEVYSNTGGQSSKSTPIGSVTKFNSQGKATKKKDLGAICMTYKNCYVASISLGADFNQTIKALKEAEEFNGPSIVIAYAPCINHGIDMSNSNLQTKLCVECGYWSLYRYNPSNKKPLTLDSNEPTKDYVEFLKSQTRYLNLLKVNPQKADEYFKQSKQDAIIRRKFLLDMLKNQENE